MIGIVIYLDLSEKNCVLSTIIEAKFILIFQLHNQHVEEIENIICNSPATGKYELVKRELIKRPSYSSSLRIRKVTGSSVSKDFLRTLWMDEPSQYIVHRATTSHRQKHVSLYRNKRPPPVQVRHIPGPQRRRNLQRNQRLSI